VKLLDDLIDADQGLHRWDQVLGIALLQRATTILGSHDNSVAVLNSLENDFNVVWRQEVLDRRESPFSLEEWIAGARAKVGRMLGGYAAACCLAADVTDAIPAAVRFGDAFGVLCMIGDDSVDYTELGESDGNLTAMVATEQVTWESFLDALQSWRVSAIASLGEREIAFDIRPFIESFAAKIVRLYRASLDEAGASRRGSSAASARPA
jgi:hypothetical protein